MSSKITYNLIYFEISIPCDDVIFYFFLRHYTLITQHTIVINFNPIFLRYVNVYSLICMPAGIRLQYMPGDTGMIK